MKAPYALAVLVVALALQQQAQLVSRVKATRMQQAIEAAHELQRLPFPLS